MSFAKIFASIYEGTLAEHWQALVTFQQMLILCDASGIVDMTPNAMHRITGIPIDVIRAGIEILESPDSDSRSQAMGGRRIARLDNHREWGWFIVNHSDYRKRISAEEKREADRERIAEKRECRKVSQGVACNREEAQAIAEVAQAEAEAEIEAKKNQKSVPHSATRGVRLAQDWQPTELELRWAIEARPDVSAQAEVEKFRDYWHAKTGRDACKRDWPATWRNWIRNSYAAKPRAGPSSQNGSQQVGKTMQGINSLERIKNHALGLDNGGAGDGVAKAALLGPRTTTGG